MSPKFRQSFYYLSTVALAILGIAQVWHGIDAGVAENLTQIITGFGTLLGAGAPAVAGSKVQAQRSDGTFDTVTPADAVINGVQAVLEAKASAESDIERVKAAVTDIAAVLPALGPLATQLLR